MTVDVDILTTRFEKSLYVLMQNLGPQLITRAQLGLTPGQVFMLYFIREESRCKISALAEKLEVSPSAATIMLDRLESHGFVVRTRDEDDRRVVHIELTSTGEEKLEEVLLVRQRIIKSCFGQMRPDKLGVFVDALEELSTIANSVDYMALIGTTTEED